MTAGLSAVAACLDAMGVGGGLEDMAGSLMLDIGGGAEGLDELLPVGGRGQGGDHDRNQHMCYI